MSRRALSLFGRDYPELGPVAWISFADAGAVALTRGAEPKPYAHVDPNEDAALLMRATNGDLLAVTDGYNGAGAAELALQAVHAHADALLAPEAEAFEQAVRDAVHAIALSLRSVAPSRTCLVLAALAAGRCRVASFGDSAAFRATRSPPLVPPNELDLRPGLADVGLPSATLWSAVCEPEPGERIALVSDGVTNYLRDPEGISSALLSAGDDAEAALALLRGALQGGAGDNAAAAVLTPSASPDAATTAR